MKSIKEKFRKVKNTMKQKYYKTKNWCINNPEWAIVIAGGIASAASHIGRFAI